MHLCVFKIADSDIKLDVFDNERATPKSNTKYYITPSRVIRAKTWMIEHNIKHKLTAADALQLISAEIIGTYKR